MQIAFRYFITFPILALLTSYGCHNPSSQYINQGISVNPYKVYVDSGTKAQYISFENPHINTITYSKNGYAIGEIGDIYPFNIRPIPSRNFIIPLDSANTTKSTYTFIISKKGENLSFKWELLNKQELKNKLRQEYVFLGIILGSFGIIISLGLVLVFVTREKNEIYFLIYVLLSMSWLLNELGFLYQYIWPDSPKFHQLSRTIFSTMSLSSYVLMIFKSYQPKLKLPIKVFFLGFLLFILLRIFFLFIRIYFNLGEQAKTIGLYSNAILLLGLFLYFLYLLNKKVFTKETNFFEKAGIYLYLTIIVSEALHQFGIDIFGPLKYYSSTIFIFFIVQILTTAISISLNYYQKKMMIENEKQAILINLERDINQSMLTGQELERERIGKNIHDEIGSLLASIKLNISTLKNKYGNLSIKKDLDKLYYLINLTIENKYQIIYDLAPIGNDVGALKDAVLKRIKLYSANPKLKFQVHIDDKIDLSAMHISTLYRIILELLNNGIKHAKASKIYLIVIQESNSIVKLQYEDNGIGFDVQKTINQGGFRTILINLKSINGRYELNSGSQGTRFVIFINSDIV